MGLPKAKRKYLIFLLLAGISVFIFYLLIDRYQPLHKIESKKAPFFSDDMDRESLIQAAEKQVHFLQSQVQSDTIHLKGTAVPYSWFLLSMREFLEKLKSEPDILEINQFLVENYDIYQAGGREKNGSRRMLVTGYYEPHFNGNLQAIPPYNYPLYKVPTALIKKGKKVGRYKANGEFADFWSRKEIESGNVLAGSELLYLADRFDAYLLHVQGSGKIILPNGTTSSVHFAGSNGLGYNSIGKLLVDEKIMKLDDVSIPTIRQYLAENPSEVDRILHHNPRFIFFSLGDDLGPRGSSGEVLTPGRSVALDSETLPTAAFGFLMTKRPEVNSKGTITTWLPLNRFVFPQDSGSAIKGTGRVDIFWGNGLYAETAANNMKEGGELYFFVKKGYSY